MNRPETKFFQSLTVVFFFAASALVFLAFSSAGPRDSNDPNFPIADTNGDRTVNIVDLSYLLGNWLTADQAADFNGDSVVNVVDLSYLLAQWGRVDSPPPDGVSIASQKLGFYPGGGTNEIDVFESYEQWLGRSIGEVAHATINHGYDAPPNWQGGGWEMVQNAYGHWGGRPDSEGRGWNDRPDVVVATSMPLLPYERGNISDQVRVEYYNRLLSGEIDNRYLAVANWMKDADPSRIIIRLGSEPEINYYPWSIRDKTPGDQYNNMHELYKQAYRHVVDLFRSVDPGFRFDYNGNGLFDATNPLTGTSYMESAYPGDDYVDIIGINVYDKAGHQAITNRMNAVRDFAIARGKQVSLPEWGLWKNGCSNVQDDGNGDFGGGDNPAFIQLVYDFMEDLPDAGAGSLAYHGYFMRHKCVNFIDPDNGSARFPQAEALFKQLFGPGTY